MKLGKYTEKYLLGLLMKHPSYYKVRSLAINCVPTFMGEGFSYSKGVDVAESETGFLTEDELDRIVDQDLDAIEIVLDDSPVSFVEINVTLVSTRTGAELVYRHIIREEAEYNENEKENEKCSKCNKSCCRFKNSELEPEKEKEEAMRLFSALQGILSSGKFPLLDASFSVIKRADL